MENDSDCIHEWEDIVKWEREKQDNVEVIVFSPVIIGRKCIRCGVKQLWKQL